MERPPHVRAIQSMRPETARALIEALTALVKPRYPYHVTGGDTAKRRVRAFAAAMLADSISTVEGISHLAERHREA